MIDYAKIERVAKYICQHFPPNVDWQDLAQESAIAALRGRKSIDGPMIDWLRTKAGVVKTARYDKAPDRRYVLCLPLARWLPLPSHEPDIIAKLDALSLLSTLPERKEMILTLSYWGGLTNREISKAFGVNESRISQQKKEALEQLRRVAA